VSKPPTIAELTWQHDLVFEAASGIQRITTDGDSRQGPSPLQLLAVALAGCMSADVAYTLTKGRHAFRSLRCRIVADRAQDTPHRFVKVVISFVVEGSVPPDAVSRAIALSHEKYCSVWHSMREDIAFSTDYELRP
jgi:putative redox protein